MGTHDMAGEFEFLDPGTLRDGDLELALVCKKPGDPTRQYAPGYEFEMRTIPGGRVMGLLRFRVGNADTILRYPCHIGYEVDPAFRGHRYAARSLRLILPFAQAHGLTRLWIGCKPDNVASRRTCELAGATPHEIVDVPDTHEMYRKGIHRCCRHWIDLYDEPPTTA